MTYNPDRADFAAPDRRPSLQEQWREVSARIDAEDALRMTGEADSAGFIAVAPPPTFDAAGRALRHDGWTPDRQRLFLSAIADGETVERACRLVQMSPASAYAFRQRAAGQPFALGWRAANLLGRDRIADRLMARAIDGQVETTTRPDGSVVSRHRYDNRAALNLLARLDRIAEQTPADPAAAASSHAARLVAQDFEAYLDLIERDDGPARAGLFLARRTGLAGAPAAAPEIEPVLALARADRFVRTGASHPQEVDTTDLDLAQRHTWTAEQWQRADAAGLLRVAPEEAPPPSPLPPFVEAVEPIFWDDDAEEYRTCLPPPEGEKPDYEHHDYGHPDYVRGLTDSEQALMDRLDAAETAERHGRETAERDAWFARIEADIAAVERAGEQAKPDTPCLPGAGRGPVSGNSVEEDGDCQPEEPDAGVDPA